MVSAHRDIKALYDEALRGLAGIDPLLHRRMETAFGWVGEAADPAALASGIVLHHERTQKAKPPNGKRGWFDNFADGRVAIRPGYVFEGEFTTAPTKFVHAYRTRPIWSFAKDLGTIKSTVEV